ncbi:DUF1848 domain-containing protein [Selenomonas sp. TAMA-11512]|uniref:DUF1848 domain-containing protein n=1 Tax=Selenomonas sp. TAMA-11512 TaxID=3095337 RepID=UPI00308AFD1B|nr:DUF1848 domain-containing protein [Selenomonas sp. TAMA-11512]
MILNTGNRTDIPGFYSTWLYNRIEAGEVLTRNPYNPTYLTRYRLTPDLVDIIIFTTKNPEPMLDRLNFLSAYRTFWGITITPYSSDIEPYVPPVNTVIDQVIALSKHIGKRCVHWRYDPICITDKYTIEYHKRAFRNIAEKLSSHIDACVISFIDLYKKTRRNFPEAREVSREEQHELSAYFSSIAKETGITLRTCLEGEDLRMYGIDTTGCMTKAVLEHAIGETLHIPVLSRARDGCDCLLGNDIGTYNTCGHFCRYCYANEDPHLVRHFRARHDPSSPLLIGHVHPGDTIHDAKQESYIHPVTELTLF